ncbi:MAG: phosphatidate cytidylyltransferase [Bryobacteraceae bacterium]
MKRVLTAAVLAPLVCWVVLGQATAPFAIALSVVAFFCFLEYGVLARVAGIEARVIGFVSGFLLLWMPAYNPALLLGAALLAFVVSLRRDSTAEVLPHTSALVFGIVYCFGPWRCARELRIIGPFWLLYALALNWIGDMAAFYVGSRWGRRKLAPRISPAKSWEGTAASAAASALFGVFFLGAYAPERGWAEVVVLSVVANVAGQAGDLCESALKRGVGVKDSGTLLPGHGGWLDRVDSSLFSLPVVYLWLSWQNLLP